MFLSKAVRFCDVGFVVSELDRNILRLKYGTWKASGSVECPIAFDAAAILSQPALTTVHEHFVVLSTDSARQSVADQGFAMVLGILDGSECKELIS